MQDRRFSMPLSLDSVSEIRYIPNALYPDIPVTDDDYYMITVEGDRYDRLAQQFYGNSDYWWIIALANEDTKLDSLNTAVGVQIRVPADPGDYIEEFNRLNKLY